MLRNFLLGVSRTLGITGEPVGPPPDPRVPTIEESLSRAFHDAHIASTRMGAQLR